MRYATRPPRFTSSSRSFTGGRNNTTSQTTTTETTIPQDIVDTSTSTTTVDTTPQLEGYTSTTDEAGNTIYSKTPTTYSKLRLKYPTYVTETHDTFIPESYTVHKDGTITYEKRKVYTKKVKNRARFNDIMVSERAYYDNEGNYLTGETYDTVKKTIPRGYEREIVSGYVPKEKDWSDVIFQQKDTLLGTSLKTGKYENPIQYKAKVAKLTKKNFEKENNITLFKDGYEDHNIKKSISSYSEPTFTGKGIKPIYTTEQSILPPQQPTIWQNMFAGNIQELAEKSRGEKTLTGRVLNKLSQIPKHTYNNIVSANIMFEVRDEQNKILNKYIKKQYANEPYTVQQYDQVLDQAKQNIIQKYKSKPTLTKGEQKRLTLLENSYFDEKAKQGSIELISLLGIGAASKFVPILLRKGFQLGAAYFGGKALKTKSEEDIINTILFALPEAGRGIKFIKRNIPALTREGIFTVAKYPKRPRPLILKDIYTKERQQLATTGGTRSATKIYAEGITGKIGRYATQSLPKGFTLKSGKTLKTIEVGDAFLNPMRNPTYWKRQIHTLIGKRTYGTSPKATFNPKIWEWSKKKQHIILRDKHITKKDIPPKTKKGYTQPEHEVFDTSKPLKKMFIGYTRDGIKLYYEYPKGTYLPTKLKQIHKNLLSQLHKKDIEAWHVAQRGIEKAKLIEQKNPLGDVYDNSGFTHVDRIKKIGRRLGVQNKKLLDAFAEVHDIYKQPVYNFKTEFAISRGVKKGFYDSLQSIKKLSAKEKKQLAKLIEIDEKPPINLGNLRKRPQQTIHYSLKKLTNEEKAIINADRLARFGNKADKDMIFNLHKEHPLHKKRITINKKQQIKNTKPIKNKKLKENVKNLREQKEYYKSYYKKNKYKQYKYLQQKKYLTQKYNYKKTTSPTYTTYTKNPKRVIPYTTTTYTSKYTTGPKRYINSTIHKPYNTTYTTSTKTKPSITTTTYKTTNKKIKKRVPLKKRDTKQSAIQPHYYDAKIKKIIKGALYKDSKTAHQTASYFTDKTPITAFELKTVKGVPRAQLRKGIRYNKPHKFRRNGKKTIEKRYHRYDSKGERKSGFNTLAFLAQHKTKGTGYVGKSKINL